MVFVLTGFSFMICWLACGGDWQAQLSWDPCAPLWNGYGWGGPKATFCNMAGQLQCEVALPQVFLTWGDVIFAASGFTKHPFKNWWFRVPGVYIYIYMCVYIYINIPGTQMTSVLIGISAFFWGVDLQQRSWLGSRYRFLKLHIYMYQNVHPWESKLAIKKNSRVFPKRFQFSHHGTKSPDLPPLPPQKKNKSIPNMSLCLKEDTSS